MAKKARTRPRKEPQQERSRQTIEAILTATARVLKKDGFDRASTNKIAEAAGVSIGSLYQYFPSKEALVAALAERHIDEMLAELETAFERAERLPLRVAVRELVSLMLRAHAVDPELHKVLVEQVPRVGRLDRIAEVELRVQARVREWLEANQDQIRDKDPDLAAFVAVTAVEALTHAVVVARPRALSQAATAAEIADLITRYLARD